ncbi:MAG: amidohydrolase family protein [Bryobacterales bacterium]|nr:amidohydrolase family protein [Bryobacterales bacterium]
MISFTPRLALLSAAALLLAACSEPAPTGPQVLIGATLLDSSTRSTIDRAVVIVEHDRFKAVGDQPTLPIPPGSHKLDLTGRFLIPTPVELPSNTKFVHVKTLAEMQKLLIGGAKVIHGLPLDAATLEAALLQDWKRDEIIVFPWLNSLEVQPHYLKRGRELAKALFDSGVKLGVSGVESAHREWKFLSEAGLPAEAIIQATTLHAAQAISGPSASSGRIAAGLPADLYVLKCDPRDDIACLVKVERAMKNGQWVQPPALGEN